MPEGPCDPKALPPSSNPGFIALELEELSPMEVSFDSNENSAEVVPVSFETVVTETGMLQLWAVSRDGRRWKLEFNVRERV